jgi:membrane fusion protein (multidrug efflux system)
MPLRPATEDHDNERTAAADNCGGGHARIRLPVRHDNYIGLKKMDKTTGAIPRIASRLTLMLALCLAACGSGNGKSDHAATALPTLLIAPEDIYVVTGKTLGAGPSITGSVQPERRADLRAEVAAVVLRVFKENGDRVRKGDLLVQLDDTAIREALGSSEASARSAAQSFDQAERQFQRMKTLRASGMASAQQLDDAEARRNNASADLEAAKSRQVQARQQLQRTEARAPFDGIVSERKVSAGDTAQLGQQLLKVIDPRSMRFEGLVSADRIAAVRPGQNVVLHASGYGSEEFLGKVRRVNPAANPTTRQIEVLVDFVGGKQPALGGLYAEGRIDAGSTNGISLPAAAMLREDDKYYVWRLSGGSVAKTELALGERDPRSGEFVILRGLAEGDRILRHPTPALRDGQKFETSAAAIAAPADASAKRVN